MKRLFVLVLALSMLVSLAACGDGWTAATHKELSYSVRRSWSKDDDEGVNIASYVQYVSKDNSQVAIQLRVSRDDFFSDEAGSLLELAESARDSYLGAFENSVPTRFEPCTINDLPAYEVWMTCDGWYDDTIELRMILVEKPDGIYLVVLEGSSDYSGDFAADYETIKNSIK